VLATEDDDLWQIASITHCQSNMVTGEDAWQLLAKAERLYRQLGDSFYRTRVVGNFGWRLLADGEVDRAAGYFQDSMVLAEEVGDVVQLANCCTDLAACRFLSGDTEGAVSMICRSIQILARIRARRIAAEALVLVSAIASERGARGAAVQLVAAARRLIEQAESTFTPIENRFLAYVSDASEALDGAATEARLSLDLDAALELALTVLGASDGTEASVASVAPQRGVRIP
jgi:hypothetical protein